MADGVAEVLQRVPLFFDLDPSEISAIADAMASQVFPPGAVVTAEGTGADGFYVVDTGEADVAAGGRNIGHIGPGDCFGETALLMGSERTATITAITELSCYRLAPDAFRVIAEENPAIAWKLYQGMARWMP